MTPRLSRMGTAAFSETNDATTGPAFARALPPKGVRLTQSLAKTESCALENG